jgi:hypothetical protein
MNSTTQIHLTENITAPKKLEPIFSIYPANTNRNLNTTNFDELLLETVDSVFFMLGNSCKQAIYYHLSNSYSLKRENIAHNVAAFAGALEDIFGQGSLLLEAKIIQELHCKVRDIKYFPKQRELSFAAYLENLRSYM